MTDQNSPSSVSLRALLSSKRFHSVVGIAVSTVLIIWIVWSVEWEGVAAELQNISYWALIPSTLVLLGHYILRAWRWRYLLPSTQQRPTILELHDALMLGNFATYVLPLRAGEFVRPFALTLRSAYSFSTCFVSVVLERFFDLSFVLLSFAVVLHYVTGIPPWVEKGAYALTLIAVAILLFIVIGTLFPQFVTRIVKAAVSPLPPRVSRLVAGFVTDLLGGAAVLRHGGNLVVVIVLTAAVWFSGYALFYVYGLLFDLNLSLVLSVTVGVVIALAVAAPSAPGFIGVYQTACIASFELFHLSRESAVAYSLVTHIFQYLVFILYTIWYLRRTKLSFASIFRTKPPVAANP